MDVVEITLQKILKKIQNFSGSNIEYLVITPFDLTELVTSYQTYVQNMSLAAAFEHFDYEEPEKNIEFAKKNWNAITLLSDISNLYKQNIAFVYSKSESKYITQVLNKLSEVGAVSFEKDFRKVDTVTGLPYSIDLPGTFHEYGILASQEYATEYLYIAKINWDKIKGYSMPKTYNLRYVDKTMILNDKWIIKTYRRTVEFNDNLANHLLEQKEQTSNYTKADVEKRFGKRDYSIPKIINELGFSHELKKLFFPTTTKTAFTFRRFVTEDEFSKLPINKKKLQEQLTLLDQI